MKKKLVNKILTRKKINVVNHKFCTFVETFRCWNTNRDAPILLFITLTIVPCNVHSAPSPHLLTYTFDFIPVPLCLIDCTFYRHLKKTARFTFYCDDKAYLKGLAFRI